MEKSKREKSKTENISPVERSEIHEHFSTIDTTVRSDGGHETRAKEHNQITLEESTFRETTRKATHEEMMAIMNAQFYGFDEFQIGKEINIKDVEKMEIEHNISGVSVNPDGKKVLKSEQYRQEQIIEGPRIGDISETFHGASKTEKVALQHNITVEDDSDKSRIGAKEHNANLTIEASTPIYENVSSLNSLHRIRHKRHVLEEIVLEDVDTFYEDKSKKRLTLTKSLVLESPEDLNKENIIEGIQIHSDKNYKHLKTSAENKNSDAGIQSFSKTFVVNNDMPWVKMSQENLVASSTIPFPKADKIYIKTGSYNDETKTFIITDPFQKEYKALNIDNKPQSPKEIKPININDETKTFIINYDNLIGHEEQLKPSMKTKQYFIEHDTKKTEYLNPKQLETQVTQVSYISDNLGAYSPPKIIVPVVEKSFIVQYDDPRMNIQDFKLPEPSVDIKNASLNKPKDYEYNMTYQVDYSDEFNKGKFQAKSKPAILSKKRKYEVQEQKNDQDHSTDQMTYVVNYDELPRGKKFKQKLGQKQAPSELTPEELTYVINYGKYPVYNKKSHKTNEKEPIPFQTFYNKNSNTIVDSKDVIDDLPTVVTESNPLSQKELYLDDSTNIIYEESKYKQKLDSIKSNKKDFKIKSNEIFIDEDINVFTDVGKEKRYKLPKQQIDINVGKFYDNKQDFEDDKVKTYIIEHEKATEGSKFDKNSKKFIVNYDDQQVLEPISKKKIKDRDSNITTSDREFKRNIDDEIQMSQTYIIEHPTIIKPPLEFNEKSNKKLKKPKLSAEYKDDENKTYIIEYQDESKKIKKADSFQINPLDFKTFIVQHDDFENSLPKSKKLKHPSPSEVKQVSQDNAVFTVVEDNPRKSLIMSSPFGQAELISSDDIDLPSLPKTPTKQIEEIFDDNIFIVEHEGPKKKAQISNDSDTNLYVNNVTYVVQHDEIEDIYNTSSSKKDKIKSKLLKEKDTFKIKSDLSDESVTFVVNDLLPSTGTYPSKEQSGKEIVTDEITTVVDHNKKHKDKKSLSKDQRVEYVINTDIPSASIKADKVETLKIDETITFKVDQDISFNPEISANIQSEKIIVDSKIIKDHTKLKMHSKDKHLKGKEIPAEDSTFTFIINEDDNTEHSKNRTHGNISPKIKQIENVIGEQFNVIEEHGSVKKIKPHLENVEDISMTFINENTNDKIISSNEKDASLLRKQKEKFIDQDISITEEYNSLKFKKPKLKISDDSAKFKTAIEDTSMTFVVNKDEKPHSDAQQISLKDKSKQREQIVGAETQISDNTGSLTFGKKKNKGVKKAHKNETINDSNLTFIVNQSDSLKHTEIDSKSKSKQRETFIDDFDVIEDASITKPHIKSIAAKKNSQSADDATFTFVVNDDDQGLSQRSTLEKSKQSEIIDDELGEVDFEEKSKFKIPQEDTSMTFISNQDVSLPSVSKPFKEIKTQQSEQIIDNVSSITETNSSLKFKTNDHGKKKSNKSPLDDSSVTFVVNRDNDNTAPQIGAIIKGKQVEQYIDDSLRINEVNDSLKKKKVPTATLR